MERIDKFKGLSVKKADATADIDLINQYAVKKLAPEDVYCFSLVLCDNDVDRDTERFTEKTLDQLAKLFVGKTGISDHRWSAERQIARIYRTEVVEAGGKNALGMPLKQLRASAYMVRNETNQPIIDAIDAGITKEISIGCATKACNCSICKKPQRLNWSSWTYQCETGHIKGETYAEGLCCGELEDATDAYEFSFVAVPAQKGAGVTKSIGNIDDALEALMDADLSSYGTKIKALMPRMQAALTADAERAERAAFIKSAEKYRA